MDGYNENTPIEVKLMVLDSCMFNSILFGVETWGNISCIEDELKAIEMKALKAILKVKTGTTNDLILHELQRCNIIAKIKDMQCIFFKKLLDIPLGEAVVRSVMQMCEDSIVISYYSQLKIGYATNDIIEREKRIAESTASMCIYYCNFNFIGKNCIYSSFLNDYHRYIISRWRLSNHDLKIETGRYTKPCTPREERLCNVCNSIEDEYHVIFVCPLYTTIRHNYVDLVESNNISMFLDPSFNRMKRTANFLHEIELFRKSNNLSM